MQHWGHEISKPDRKMLIITLAVSWLFIAAVIATDAYKNPEPVEPDAPTEVSVESPAYVWVDTEYCVPADEESAVGHGLLCQIDPDATR